MDQWLSFCGQSVASAATAGQSRHSTFGARIMTGHSQRLRLCDITAVHRLVRDACELGHDAIQWRTHLLMRLEPTIGAPSGLAYVGALPFDSAHVDTPICVLHGMHLHWLKYFGSRDVSP